MSKKFIKAFRELAKTMRTAKNPRFVDKEAFSKKTANKWLRELHKNLSTTGKKVKANQYIESQKELNKFASKTKSLRSLKKGDATKMNKALDVIKKEKSNVRFIRKNGRIIPIKVKK